MSTNKRFTGMQGFYAVLVGQLVSTIGSGMTRFGLGVWVLAQTGDATAYTTMLFFAVFPIGLGSLFAGPLIDRWNRRHVMIVGNIVASLSTLVIAILFFRDDLALWQLYVALFVNGIANAFILPSLQSSTPLLVPKDHLNRAAGLNQLIRALEAILAPGLAGFIVASLGLDAVFMIDFVTFSVSIVALLATVIPQPRRATGQPAQFSYWRDFASGFRYIRDRPAFLYLLGLFTVTMFLLPGLGYSLVAPLVLSFETEEVLGLVMAAYGIGSLLGGILMAAWRGKFRRMYGILAGMTAAGIAAIIIGVGENAWLIGASLLMTGISFVFVSGLNRVIWQVKAAPEMQGRIFSLQAAIGVGAQSLGILLSGILATNLFEPLLIDGGPLASSVGALIGTGSGRGIAFMFMLVGLMQLIIVLVSSLIPKVRLLEDQLPDADLAGTRPLGAGT